MRNLIIYLLSKRKYVDIMFKSLLNNVRNTENRQFAMNI